MVEFFRHCPACGRRFHIKLESKKMISEHREHIDELHNIRYDQLRSSPVLVVYEGGPIFVDIEEFQYMYKCNHCGHEWTEKKLEEHREGRRAPTE